MNKNVNLSDFVDVMREQLNNGKSVSFVPRGDSMRPMLIGGEDMVILEKPRGRLRLFDVALYYRRETDRYVIHRVVGFQEDSCYIMLGDNNFQKEYNIGQEDIVAVVKAYHHKGKMRTVDSAGYRLYCNLWYYSRPLRLLILMIRNKLRK